MKTKITLSPSIAARFIQAGEVVAFPTETVYGLGANIFNEDSIRKIFVAKGRPSDNPLIAHIVDFNQLEQITRSIPPIAKTLMAEFFPGALTLVLPKNSRISTIATAGLETIGVRMPNHPIARQFLRACGMPLVAPSANRSGRPSPTTWQAVREDLQGHIACLLQGNQTQVGLESTVVDCTGATPLILRAGGVTLEQLRKIIPETDLADPNDDAAPKSPGMRHRHYAPTAQVVISNFPQFIEPAHNSAYIGIDPPSFPANFKRTELCEGVNAYAHALFQFFRECDEAGMKTIFCQAVREEGIGLALMDRLRRAAQD